MNLRHSNLLISSYAPSDQQDAGLTSIRQSKPADLAGPYTQFLSQFLVKPAIWDDHDQHSDFFRLGSMFH